MGIYQLINEDGAYTQIILSHKLSLINALAHALRHSDNVRNFIDQNGISACIEKRGRNDFSVSFDGDEACSVNIQHITYIDPYLNRIYVD